MKNIIINILKKRGFQIKRYPDFNLVRRIKIITTFNINILFDIGANAGQYAINMRELGYKHKIISFEPLKSAYKELEKASVNDNNWVVNNFALGNDNIASRLNVSGNSFSSSILKMQQLHLDLAPESKYVTQEEIEIKKLDSIMYKFCTKQDSIMIKIDTQGFEKNVLDGAIDSLTNIKIIQLEMSIVSLYVNEMLFIEMINYLDNKGFQLFSLENGLTDSYTGQLLQLDGIFVRKNLL
jgi:FkbM family methyltransferase